MNAFQVCHNSSDLVPFYLPQQLYLKPIARINISLQLPNVKKLGKSVSHWEIMDKIKMLIRPDEFTVLKVTKTTVEFVRFEGELETKDKIARVLAKIDNKMIKLKDFSELMRVKAAEWKSDFPHRRVWDDFFSSAKDMDEMKPGQRPDTVYISNLPTNWFVPYHLSGEDAVPSEKIFYRVFEKFGSIRYVDIPICDPYRKKMKDHISGLKNSSFERTEFFEGYIQFKDYIGFTRAMDALRNMKLVHKEEDTATEVNIKVDFDKSKHLSDGSIRRREIVRDRLITKAREQEEKDKAALEEKNKREEQDRQRELDIKEQKKLRRKLREEKRKAKILEKLEISGSDEINEKIAKEEKKLLRVQRKLEAIRLVEELFRRIQDKNPHNILLYDDLSNPSRNELRNFKNSSELEVLNQKEKLHNVLKGRVMLKTILADSSRTRRYSSSSSNSDISLDIPIHSNAGQRPKSPVFNKYPELFYEPTNWLGYPPYMHPGSLFSETYHPLDTYIPRGRGFPRLPNIAGPSRGSYNRRRGGYRYRGGGRGGGKYNQYSQDVEEDYYKKYINKYLNEHNTSRRSYSPNRRTRDRSRSRSHSSSRRSYSRSRRSYSRSRSRSRTRKRSRDRRSRSYNYRSRSRSSRSRSRSKSSRKSSGTPKHENKRSRSISRDKKRSRSRTPRSNDRTRKRSSERLKTKKDSETNKCRSSEEKKSTSTRSREQKSRSRSREKNSKSRSREKRSRSCSREKKSRSRSREKKSRSRSRDKSRSCSREKTRTCSKDKPRSHSREKSVDSSTFMTPQQFSERRARSKSWSLPKEGESKNRSWSKSPEKKN